MPYTRKQVRYLLSDVSPMTGKQKAKMKRELHRDPAMGHKETGKPMMDKAMKRKHEEMLYQ